MALTKPDKSSWLYLPAELRNIILDTVLQTGSRVASLAAVSQEWQAMIEPRNFSRIKLTAPRLAEFGSMTRRNRALVCYIWLCLELQEYDCTQCAPHLVDGLRLTNADNIMLITAFQDLFSTLSTWEPTGSLLLDISVYAPSDAEHWFEYLTFRPDIPSPSDNHDLGLQSEQQHDMLAKPDDYQHGWIAGKPISTPCPPAIFKVFEEIMGADAFLNGEQQNKWWEHLPSAPAVTGVLLRPADPPPEIHYEPWREWYNLEQEFLDSNFQALFHSLTTRDNLRRLTLFEAHNKQYALPFVRLLPGYCSLTRVPDSKVSGEVARLSLQLEHLSASFIVDASHSLNACEPSWKWTRMTSLVLSSQLLTPDECPVKIDDTMLLTAARVALRMPNLESMEIWNGQEGFAMFFRYQLTGQDKPAVPTWRGTWGLTLRSAVVEAWEVVALSRCGRRLVFAAELLDAGVVGSLGDAILHLGFLNPVVRPVSLRQIRMEYRAREGARS
ncbi:hypothetical protein BDW42DRAFT_194164 [Aspergillus taichungensis]|uniref:DUF6546 domain-containing protein n=1 Tax=Aspergillus taichungensis TaxID=482145 RepID=A0A2J5HTU9_9EURO|nr:hypothetical protein BDW42DRAFT_194164 [Aspergillus taichungensis]